MFSLTFVTGKDFLSLGKYVVNPRSLCMQSDVLAMRTFPNSKKEDRLALDEACSLIQGQSMVPTLIHGQAVVPQSFTFQIRPRRGEHRIRREGLRSSRP